MKSPCEQCGELRELHPVTRYNAEVGHHIPMAVCSNCLGPAFLGERPCIRTDMVAYLREIADLQRRIA